MGCSKDKKELVCVLMLLDARRPFHLMLVVEVIREPTNLAVRERRITGRVRARSIMHQERNETEEDGWLYMTFIDWYDFLQSTPSFVDSSCCRLETRELAPLPVETASEAEG